MQDDWNNIVNPYTGARAGDVAKPGSGPAWDAEDPMLRNPYTHSGPAPAKPWTPANTPANPYRDAEAEAAASLPEMGRVDPAKAQRDREALERILHSRDKPKEEKKTEAPKAEMPEEKKLRLLRELAALDDKWKDDTERAFAASRPAAADVLRTEARRRALMQIDRGNDAFAASLGMAPANPRLRYLCRFSILSFPRRFRPPRRLGS